MFIYAKAVWKYFNKKYFFTLLPQGTLINTKLRQLQGGYFSKDRNNLDDVYKQKLKSLLETTGDWVQKQRALKKEFVSIFLIVNIFIFV